MRNLKRALSLLLSSTMVLGMLVMGSSAASYKDVDDSNTHQEAIEVLQAVGIMTGDQNGNFNPDGSITRNEMAVIMAHLLNLDYDYYRGTNPFTDVPEWAAPYVAACAAEGVVAGIGNGQFGGDQKVTAAQASLMIMKALGYFENAEDFGTDWQVATIRQASYINLFDQINASAESALTRGQVAQLVLNGLQAKTVYFTGDKGIQIGDVTVGYRAEYTPKTGTDKKYNTLVSGKTDISEQGQYYIQLGEELYEGQLRKAPDADEFDRPAFTWSYKAQKIGTYVDWSLLVKEYTTAVTGEDLYNTLTSSAIKAYDFAYYVDGKVSEEIKTSNMIRTNDTKYATTGNGALTQVFVDNEEGKITITTINTYLAQATADYNEKKENLSLDVKQNDRYVFNTTTVSLADIPGIEKYKEEDFVVVNVAENSNGKYDIITVADPEVMSDTTLTKYSVNSYVVADGTQYDYAKKGTVYNAAPLTDYDKTALTNYTYNVYLDKYGYVIGTEIYSGEANYLFLTGYDLNGSNLAVKTATAGAIFLDGTFSEIQVNVTDTDNNLWTDKNSNGSYDSGELIDATNYPFLRGEGKQSGPDGDSEYNMWFTYTTSEKNGETVYTLAPVERWASQAATASDGKINSASVRVIDGSKVAYGNDDSVYLTVDTGSVDLSTHMGITEVTGTYTGVQNVDLKVYNTTDNKLTNDSAIMAVYDKDLYIIGAIVVGEDANATDNYAYVLEGAENEYVDSNDNYYWDFTAVVDGEIKTLTVKTKYQSVISAIQTQCGANKNGLMKLTYDVDGYVIGASVMNDTSATDKVYGKNDWNTVIDAGNETLYSMQYNGSYKLTVAGRTLYSDVNDAGLTLETGAPVIVVQEEKSNTGIVRLTYTAYTTISQALDSLNDKNDFEGWVSAVLNDKGTAEYIVINSADAIGFDSDDGSTPSTGAVANVSLTSAGAITLTDKNGAGLDGKNLSWALYMRSASQDEFNVAMDGKDIASEYTAVATAMSGKTDYSFYIVVDGVKSNTVIVP